MESFNVLEGFHFAAIVLLGVVSYFLKRAVSDVDDMEKEIGHLKEKVGILLDRDRRRRLSDYEEGISYNREEH